MRPHKQGLSYFPHDTDACNDNKIQSLMALYGTDGYTFYFILLEKVFRTENGRITLGSDAIIAGIAKTIGITIDRFKMILATAIEVGCFAKDIYEQERIITSNGIEKRITSVNNLRQKERERKDKYKHINIKNKDKRKGKTSDVKRAEGVRKTSLPLGTPTSDDDFIQALKKNIAYMGINIEKELAKMDAWFLTPNGRGRKKTKKFILAWLNKIDVPMKPEPEQLRVVL